VQPLVEGVAERYVALNRALAVHLGLDAGHDLADLATGGTIHALIDSEW
jgi:hypothetical protein